MPPSRRNATHVEIIIEDGGIHGIVRDRRGRETTFSGWLSLIAAVEACQQEGQDDSPDPRGTVCRSDQQPFDPGLG